MTPERFSWLAVRAAVEWNVICQGGPVGEQPAWTVLVEACREAFKEKRLVVILAVHSLNLPMWGGRSATTVDELDDSFEGWLLREESPTRRREQCLQLSKAWNAFNARTLV